jgi:hypothetical protein
MTTEVPLGADKSTKAYLLPFLLILLFTAFTTPTNFILEDDPFLTFLKCSEE